MEETPDIPDPLETVTILRSDFEALQAIANFAVEDVLQLAARLGMSPPDDLAPRQALYEVLFPVVEKLMDTHRLVDQSRQQLLVAAERKGMKTKTFAGGKQGLLVGQAIPGLFDGSRRERRQASKEARRGR